MFLLQDVFFGSQTRHVSWLATTEGVFCCVGFDSLWYRIHARYMDLRTNAVYFKPVILTFCDFMLFRKSQFSFCTLILPWFSAIGDRHVVCTQVCRIPSTSHCFLATAKSSVETQRCFCPPRDRACPATCCVWDPCAADNVVLRAVYVHKIMFDLCFTGIVQSPNTNVISYSNPCSLYKRWLLLEPSQSLAKQSSCLSRFRFSRSIWHRLTAILTNLYSY